MAKKVRNLTVAASSRRIGLMWCGPFGLNQLFFESIGKNIGHFLKLVQSNEGFLLFNKIFQGT